MTSAIKVQKRVKWSPIDKPAIFEELNVQKIYNRIKYLTVGHDMKGGEDIASNTSREVIKIGPPLFKINIQKLVDETVKFIINGTKTSEIDEFTIKCCLEHTLESREYNILAGRIVVSSLHKETPERFIDAMRYAFFNKTKFGEAAPQIRQEILLIVSNFQNELEKMIDHRRDYLLDYFGLITLIRPGGVAYLAKDSRGNIIERPQFLFMRTALEIHRKGLESHDSAENKRTLAIIKSVYDMLSCKFATHATPTLANSCTIRPQLASCFLSCVFDDSIDGIFESIKKNAILCKNMGGLGLLLSNVRAEGALIKSSGGKSRGVKPLLKVIDNTFGGYLDQGGKRKGSLAAYLDVWHSDLLDFVRMPRNTQGNDEDRARNLFYAVVVNNVFMEAAEYECQGCDGKCPGMHYFMSPDDCPRLLDSMNADYAAVYSGYIAAGKYYKAVHAREVLYEIIFSMINCGKLYVINRDSANRSNNLSNVGNINCSNLCTEIMLPVRLRDMDKTYNTDLISVCNLASVKLDTFYSEEFVPGAVALKVYDFYGRPATRYFNLNEYIRTVQKLVRNIDNIIDNTYYPEELTKKTNQEMRPIGLGVQGLADLFIKLNLPYESDRAKLLNYFIWHWMYHSAMQETIKLAKERGPYKYFSGSPASKGVLQFDTWPAGQRPSHLVDNNELFDASQHYDFEYETIRADVQEFGMRNSLLLAPMPTASTAQILGSGESFEPYTSNLFTRTTLAGQFQIVNPHLQQNMEKNGIWNPNVISTLIQDNGSVANLDIPEHAKNVFKTIYEISMKTYILMAADRARFICQSQSLNLYWSGTADEIKNKIYSALLYGWKLGLKTLCYYTRIRTACGQKIGAEIIVEKSFDLKTQLKAAKEAAEKGQACLMCAS